MAIRQRRDLRQVGDADDLAAGGQLAQLLADGAGRDAADARVDLVEDERRRAGLGRRAHQREHHARELAAGRDLAQRAGGHAGVGRDQEVHLVGARWAPYSRGASAAVNSAPSMASAPSRSRTASASATPAASRAALSARARCSSSRADDGQLRLDLLDRLLGADELVPPGAALLGVGEHRRDRAAVLALEALEQRQPLLDLVQAARAPPPRPRRSRCRSCSRSSASIASARTRTPSASSRRPRRRRRPSPAPPRRAPARRRRCRPRPRRARPNAAAAAARSASTWRRRLRSASSASSSSSLGSARSISPSSHSSRSSSRSRAPARSWSSSSALSERRVRAR